MSRWKLGSMVRINGLFHLLINGIYWDDNPLTNLLLTSWDIQACPLDPYHSHTSYRSSMGGWGSHVLGIPWAIQAFVQHGGGCTGEATIGILRNPDFMPYQIPM